MRVHLRWEAFNLEALDLALTAIAGGEVHLLAFNDHTPGHSAQDWRTTVPGRNTVIAPA